MRLASTGSWRRWRPGRSPKSTTPPEGRAACSGARRNSSDRALDRGRRRRGDPLPGGRQQHPDQLGDRVRRLVDTADNAVRRAVVPLLVGNALLFALVAYARWDIFWRDPEHLPKRTLGKVVIVLFVVPIALRFLGLARDDVNRDLVLAVLVTGVLVGLAEELVFRGVVLRCLRTQRRLFHSRTSSWAPACTDWDSSCSPPSTAGSAIDGVALAMSMVVALTAYEG